MSKLSVTHHGEEYELDEFYKSLLFQRIMDGDFNRDERDVLLVVFRKTLHFDKLHDRLGIYWLSKAVGIGQNKLRQTLKQLEAKGLLAIEHSKGGRTDSNQKFSQFSLANDFISLIVDKWINIKIDNDFNASY